MIVNDIWQEFLKIVNEEAGSRIVETWFKAVTLTSWDSNSKTVFLKAPNSFIKEWVMTNYRELMQLHLGRLFSEATIKIIFIEDSKPNLSTNYGDISPAVALNNINNTHNLNTNSGEISVYQKKPIVVAKNSNSAKKHINQNYQFDTFVVGPNNSLAYAACKAAAEKPGLLYNPLFIYGCSGLGKTHLLHAIGNQIKSVTNKSRILYQSADRFVNEFINAIRFDKVNAFEVKYKEVDVLLIDDIQFISNKEQTQEAFFHIFNALYEERKQIVFTSDSLPCDIAGLADRLRSRLSGGLIADIQPPTLETKIAIIKKKAEQHKESISDDVAYFIASRVVSNIRELEGMLIRVIAFASLTHQPISLDLANKVLARPVKEPNKQLTLDLQRIAQRVGEYYKLSVNELRSTKRQKNIVLARHVAMYFMKKLSDKSLMDIGTFFKRKDHSTVIHALEKIESYKQADQEFKELLNKLEHNILTR